MIQVVIQVATTDPSGVCPATGTEPIGCPDTTGVYLNGSEVYTLRMTKRLIDVDDDALDAARAELGTHTIKDTVNEALRRAARQRSAELARALTVLADADLDERSAAWR